MAKKCDDVVTLQGEVYIRKGSINEKKVAAVKSIQKHPFVIGNQYYFELATKYYVGNVVAVTDKFVIIDRAAWIPDTGRFNEFLATGNPKECEPCGVPVIIGIGAICTSMPSKVSNLEVK
ncbi:MAG: hypothetical protein KGL39_19680 [Patescibacteria group bacterium]|nr:hypothetical protein [Patescibacteria group bacterium]